MHRPVASVYSTIYEREKEREREEETRARAHTLGGLLNLKEKEKETGHTGTCDSSLYYIQEGLRLFSLDMVMACDEEEP
ncbi:Uncharacterized protein APZ42_032199 [Daphnia magna]|uniref:Uncharacterized protein n=1 Tax=Daphnia magna TaxID=35525 RepID=A0A164M882_9CRUS|nr:Uncharacterized protein APZ42_032199 [Daphnia magna]